MDPQIKPYPAVDLVLGVREQLPSEVFRRYAGDQIADWASAALGEHAEKRAGGQSRARHLVRPLPEDLPDREMKLIGGEAWLQLLEVYMNPDLSEAVDVLSDSYDEFRRGVDSQYSGSAYNDRLCNAHAERTVAQSVLWDTYPCSAEPPVDRYLRITQAQAFEVANLVPQRFWDELRRERESRTNDITRDDQRERLAEVMKANVVAGNTISMDNARALHRGMFEAVHWQKDA